MVRSAAPGLAVINEIYNTLGGSRLQTCAQIVGNESAPPARKISRVRASARLRFPGTHQVLAQGPAQNTRLGEPLHPREKAELGDWPELPERKEQEP